jgi:glycosyltransferase involved in cell wall biosynthesis
MIDRRVVIPLMSFNPSGGIRMVCAFANGLAGAGVETNMIAPDYAAHPPVPLDPAVETTIIPTAGSPDPKLRYASALIDTLRSETGVVVATGYLTPIIIYTAQTLADRPMKMLSLIQGYEPLSHIRYGSRPAWTKPVLHAAARTGLRLPGYKIAVSNWVAKKVGRNRIDSVVNPGIRDEFLSRIRGRDEPADRQGQTVVGAIAVAGRVKGIRFAMEAFDALKQRGADVDFVAYDADGSPVGLPDYFRRFENKGGAPGGKESMVAFYESLTIFVFPSLVEGFGLPPLEAMACGAAVVLSDSGGVREYARHEQNCLMVPPADPGAIRHAIERLIGDPRLLHTIVENGYTTAKRFPESRFVARCVDATLRYMDSDP